MLLGIYIWGDMSIHDNNVVVPPSCCATSLISPLCHLLCMSSQPSFPSAFVHSFNWKRSHDLASTAHHQALSYVALSRFYSNALLHACKPLFPCNLGYHSLELLMCILISPSRIPLSRWLSSLMWHFHALTSLYHWMHVIFPPTHPGYCHPKHILNVYPLFFMGLRSWVNTMLESRLPLRGGVNQ